MVRLIPLSIKQQTLEIYLNRTKTEHDGFGYVRFVKEINKGQNATALARMFNVSRPTMYKWLSVHEYELKRDKDEAAVESLNVK